MSLIKKLKSNPRIIITTITTMTTGMTFNNKLSLFIPRVVPEWASRELIADRFKMLDIGTISRVDFLEKFSANGMKYYQAFLHFEMWEDNAATRNIQARIYDSEKSAKLIYDDPWYWILLKNHNPLTQEEVAVNAALQERVVALEEQIVQIQNNVTYWNNVTYTQLNWHNSIIAPLWAHAVNTGMNEGQPAWLNNNDNAPTMEEIVEQTAMVTNDTDSETHSSMPSLVSASDSDSSYETESESDESSIPSLVSDEDTEYDYSDDDVVMVTPPNNHITGGTPVTPQHNYTTNHYPFDDSVVMDLTREFNTVG